MAIGHCTKCGCDFERDEAWKVLCLPCWKKTNKPKRSNSKAPDEVVRLRLRVLLLEQRLLAFQLIQRPAPAIEPEMLKRLIQLAHPDKHNGSVASQTATAWLLEQRA